VNARPLEETKTDLIASPPRDKKEQEMNRLQSSRRTNAGLNGAFSELLVVQRVPIHKENCQVVITKVMTTRIKLHFQFFMRACLI
jgi:hypothetical protein